ncbi:hypothetical protein NDU88_005890, partial [Pleurodeles waltl]
VAAEKPTPSIPYELLSDELTNSRLVKIDTEHADTTAQNLSQLKEDFLEFETEKNPPEAHLEVLQSPTFIPTVTELGSVNKKPPSLRQVNRARKLLRPKTISTILPKASTFPTLSSFSSPTFTEDPEEMADILNESGEQKQELPDQPERLSSKAYSRPIPQAPFQFSSFTPQPSNVPPFQDMQDTVRQTLPDINVPLRVDGNVNNTEDRDLNYSIHEDNQETTTSTIITTTVITTEQTPVLCSVMFYDPEGYIDSTDYPPLPLHNYLECTYNVTVYTGYGVEL